MTGSGAASSAPGRREIHVADARDSFRKGDLESALGHSLALLLAPGSAEAAAPLRAQVMDQCYQGFEACKAANDLNGTLSWLARLILCDDAEIALRELFDVLLAAGRFADVVALRRDCPSLIARGDPHFVHVCFVEAIARGRLGGLDVDAALEAASLETLAVIDQLIVEFPERSGLWGARFERNMALGRYRDMIRDLKCYANRAGDEPWESDYLAKNLLFLLRDAAFPEVARRIDGFLERLPDDVTLLSSWHHSMVGMRATPQARRLVERLAALRPEYGAIPEMEAMIDDQDRQPDATFGRAPEGRHLIYATLVCWGAGYVGLMERATIRSLLASGNFPTLCLEHDVVLEIVTDRAGVVAMTQSPGLRRLAAHCQIKLFALPEAMAGISSSLPYVIFGHASHFTIRRAQRDGADLIFLLPDVFYADGGFATIADMVTRAPRAFFADGLNAAATPMLKALDAFADADGAVAAAPRTVIQLALPHLMPRSTDHFYDPNGIKTSVYPSRIVFVTPQGLMMHSFTKGPTYLSNAAFAGLTEFNNGSPDGRFSLDVLDAIERDALVEIDSTDKFMLVELSDSEGLLWEKEEQSLADAVIGFFRSRTFSERSIWLFEQGVMYHADIDEHECLIEESEYLNEMATLAETMRTHPVFTELLVEQRALFRQSGESGPPADAGHGAGGA